MHHGPGGHREPPQPVTLPPTAATKHFLWSLGLFAMAFGGALSWNNWRINARGVVPVMTPKRTPTAPGPGPGDFTYDRARWEQRVPRIAVLAGPHKTASTTLQALSYTPRRGVAYTPGRMYPCGSVFGAPLGSSFSSLRSSSAPVAGTAVAYNQSPGTASKLAICFSGIRIVVDALSLFSLIQRLLFSLSLSDTRGQILRRPRYYTPLLLKGTLREFGGKCTPVVHFSKISLPGVCATPRLGM